MKTTWEWLESSKRPKFARPIFIISGGQTGADQGGLLGARDVGVGTGGTAPEGYQTERGAEEALLRGFGLTAKGTYPQRTHANVRNAHGTVIFSGVMESGSLLTMNSCLRQSKPYLINPINPRALATWILFHRIQILNVAGSRESREPGIQERVRTVVREALEMLR